jgi:hypothetical protein
MMDAMSSRRPLVAATVVPALIAIACTGSSDRAAPPGDRSSTLAASVASGDLYSGAPQRFQLGITQNDNQGVKLVTFGSLGLRFTYLGKDGSAAPQPGPQTRGTYVAAPGTETGPTSPELSSPATARGVYQAAGVTFDRPGIWQVEVAADVDGLGTQTLRTAFEVSADASLPAPGDRALRTKNLTIHSKDAPPAAIDSRALDGAPVPDPELHRWTIARAIAEHRPVLVVFATPTYCQSQFCGPTTEAVEELAGTYAKKAVFIHVEIWRDYQKSVVNKAAADWLYRNGDITEPWLFLIGSDGIIRDRWGPLFDPGEVAQSLAGLPDMKP